MTGKATTDRAIWAGFWLRVGAVIVDWLILGIVGYIIGLVAFAPLAAIGSFGRLIGLVIATLYFGLLSSGPGKSQTLGMRLTKIKVVGAAGGPISIHRSLARAAVLSAPGLLNGFYLSTPVTLFATIYLIFALTIVFGLGLAQLYLLLFNSPTRRLAHDLIFSTAVVKKAVDVSVVPPTPRHANVAVIIVAVVLALSIAGFTGLLPDLFPASLKQESGALQPPFKVVTALPEVSTVGFQDNTSTSYGSNGVSKRHTLVVTVRLRRWPADKKAEIAKVRDILVSAYRFPPDEGLTIVLTYGFDLGIASGSSSYSDHVDPPISLRTDKPA